MNGNKRLTTLGVLTLSRGASFPNVVRLYRADPKWTLRGRLMSARRRVDIGLVFLCVDGLLSSTPSAHSLLYIWYIKYDITRWHIRVMDQTVFQSLSFIAILLLSEKVLVFMKLECAAIRNSLSIIMSSAANWSI